ncbi:hypothetical protein Dsin_011281 [Dipteronia sinensis]|uniref:Uncharacterized protein n=1 Tax=Dipteronia sinensis TaxID=43782 RepID=A0AAE0EDG3_9ROSI|nr:hypothetical protein Dsin_011281 [Dipteronia sinensis]
MENLAASASLALSNKFLWDEKVSGGDTGSAPAPARIKTEKGFTHFSFFTERERERDTDRRRIDTRKEVKEGGDNNNKKQEKKQSEAVKGGDTIQKLLLELKPINGDTASAPAPTPFHTRARSKESEKIVLV